MPESPLVSFYSGAAPDDRGRYLEDILGWSDFDLESHHDFIQWLFPLRTRSGANPSAPILDRETIERFRSDEQLRSNLERAFERMMRFYGFEPPGSLHWVTPHNHNYLRLTRMISSLRLLGHERHARTLYQHLLDVYERHADVIGPITFRYWSEAAN
jgi:hypothetical protein